MIAKYSVSVRPGFFANLALASKRWLVRIKWRWDFLVFDSVNFIHLRREIMHKLCKSRFFDVLDSFSKASHYSLNVLRTRFAINVLSKDCPKFFLVLLTTRLVTAIFFFNLRLGFFFLGVLFFFAIINLKWLVLWLSITSNQKCINWKN